MQKPLPNDDQLRKWIHGELDQASMDGHEDLGKLLEVSSRLELPNALSKEDAWKKLSERLPLEQEQAVTSGRRRPLYTVLALSAAAVLLFWIGFTYIFQDQARAVQTARGEQASIALPDGSSVALNAETAIQYASGNWSSGRTIQLDGEAFFEVTPGSPFVVETEAGKVEVLGTSFNVYARDDQFEVACVTGKVRVTTTDGREAALTPGQAVSLKQAENFIPFAFNPRLTSGWQKGEFYFDNAPLNEVIAVIERQFDVEIVGNIPKDQLYVGGFSNDNLEVALELVFGAYSIPYTLEQGTRVVLGEPAR